jgi:UPF0176 protein
MTTKYLTLKYYQYAHIDDPASFREAQHLYCLEQGIRGRIKVAQEGINGTICGTVTACENYMQYLKSDPRFADIVFNITPEVALSHDKLHVRLKREIVNSGLPETIAPSQERAQRNYIDTATFQKMREQEDVVLLDVRSNFEHGVGKFKGAVTFDIPNYRSFFKVAASYPFDKSKKHIVICTRGIKSEKARDYLQHTLKIPHVYHLEGGILDYAKNSDGNGFDGVCYVFDKRVVVDINEKDRTVISRCLHCKKPSSRVVNCANAACDIHEPMCLPCAEKNEGTCSKACYEHPKKRPYSSTGYFTKKSNGYNPYICARRNM